MSWPQVEKTQLPEFNRLVEMLHRYRAGEVDFEAMVQAAETLEKQLGQIWLVQDEWKRNETNQEAFFTLEEGLGLANSSLLGVHAFLTDPSRGAVFLEELQAAVELVMQTFSDLKKGETDYPTHSEVVYVQELLRIATLYSQGRLPRVSLENRLARFQEMHDELVLLFNNPDSLPHEDQIYTTQKARFEQALTQQEIGLGLTRAFLESGDKGLLEGAIKPLDTSGKALLEVQQAFDP